jgi:mercuric ion transport protein
MNAPMYLYSMSKPSWLLLLLSATAASLCCLAPVISLLTGMTGLTARVSWLAPVRPYLIVLSIIFLAFAWYQRLKPAKENCNCSHPPNKSWFQSIYFLAGISLISILIILLPLNFQKQNTTTPSSIVTPTAIHQVVYSIKGMGCAECEPEVENEVKKLPGIYSVKASCIHKNAIIRFDSTKISQENIVSAINHTGYEVQGNK